VMDKNVLTSVSLDESITLLFVKPLNYSGRHADHLRSPIAIRIPRRPGGKSRVPTDTIERGGKTLGAISKNKNLLCALLWCRHLRKPKPRQRAKPEHT
jgi:hypothetical protein